MVPIMFNLLAWSCPGRWNDSCSVVVSSLKGGCSWDAAMVARYTSETARLLRLDDHVALD